MYPLLESIKIKNGFAYHLSFHQERMNRACRDLFGTDCSVDLTECLQSVDIPETGVYKCRMLYGNGVYKREIEVYTKPTISSLKLVVDDEIDYSYKYSDRKILSDLLLQKGSADEIMIVKNNLITDASFANLIFWDGKSWFTPNKPLLKGVQREYLLKKGVISEVKINLSDLSSFQKVALINAMLDFEDKIEIPIKNIY